MGLDSQSTGQPGGQISIGFRSRKRHHISRHRAVIDGLDFREQPRHLFRIKELVGTGWDDVGEGSA
jgi:hypothetical protein